MSKPFREADILPASMSCEKVKPAYVQKCFSAGAIWLTANNMLLMVVKIITIFGSEPMVTHPILQPEKAATVAGWNSIFLCV